jgi:hypothetical protein
MTKEEVMEEVSKRLSEAAAASAPLANQMKEPVWHEAGAGMNVEQLRIGKNLCACFCTYFDEHLCKYSIISVIV